MNKNPIAILALVAGAWARNRAVPKSSFFRRIPKFEVD